MDKDKVAKWQQKIEEIFCGPSGIVGEKILELNDIERKMFKNLTSRFKGYVCIMDAFFDFYIETFQNAAARRKEYIWSELTAMITAIHVPSFWRFRASYIIFWDGYYIDALSLLRAIFENVLLIVALKLEIVTIDAVFGKIENDDSKEISEEKAYKLIRDYINKADNKIRAHLIGENSGLSSDAKNDFKIFTRILHNAVHKCKINVVQYYGPWVRHEISFPIYPKYDEELASLYMNYSWPIAWMILKTFPLLQIRDREFPATWFNKYKVLNELFEEAIEALPKMSGKSVIELVKGRFNFTDK